VTWYNVLVAVTSLVVVYAPTAATTRSCRAAEPFIGSIVNFELRAFGAEADFWDGRASLEVHLPFEWCLATEIAPQRTPTSVAATASADRASADAYRALMNEVNPADRPLAVQPTTTAFRATEADILNIRVPTKISTTYADWLLTNGILVPKLNTPGQGVDLGYNLQLQRWY
jgi:hypothetical protein